MENLLELLEKNARLTTEQLAIMLAMGEKQVQTLIERCEREGIIYGYKTLVDWEKTDRDMIQARIELKVTPKSNMGFEEIAYTIAQFPEVTTVSLMSGGYDIALTVTGKNFKEIANFVAHRLAPLDSVQSTATHFVLRKYKEKGVVVGEVEQDEREATTL